MDSSLQSESEERRCADRRTSRSHVFRDKRTGFDRRACGDERRTRDLVRGVLLGLRDSPRTLVALLLVVNALNLIDFALTLNALALGADEANPVMATLFEAGPAWAGVFKVAAVALASLLVWEWKRYRKALIAAVMMLAVFAAVFIYHIVGLTLYG
jgi:hypothetical protein